MTSATKTNSVSLKEQTLDALCSFIALAITITLLAITIAFCGAVALYDLAVITHPDHALDYAIAWGRLIAHGVF
ncbi:hypothetical protein [Paraburkholderia sp. JHI869]|uniref:hypothetical protein n=1 Tax=Paraburkholderia sp. JHI869 TaxID=3112959 RepID=UPI003179532E